MLELAEERAAVRRAIERLHLSPVLFELGARAHPPRSLYLSYLEQSHVFLGIYWQRYGWVAPDMDVSGLEDEWLLSGDRPKLLYVKEPSPDREPRLRTMLDGIIHDAPVAFKPFATAEELERLVTDDLAQLLSESFIVGGATGAARHADAHARIALPVETTSFVGRDDDLDELCAVLTDDDTPRRHAHRSRWRRQDPARDPRRRARGGQVRRRRGVRRSLRGGRGGRGARRDRRGRRRARRRCGVAGRRAPPGPRRAISAAPGRQLRARDGGGAGRRRHPRGDPVGARAGDQPRGAAHRGRARVRRGADGARRCGGALRAAGVGRATGVHPLR